MKTITLALYIITILLLISMLFSFNSKRQEGEIIPCEEITLRCMLPGKIGVEHIIRNNTDYQKLIQHKNLCSDCGNYQLPIINFYENTLIGYVSSFGGCDEPKVTHKITKSNNDYVVYIDIIELGWCSLNNSITIWCLIPKIEENASVKFNITNTLINNKE